MDCFLPGAPTAAARQIAVARDEQGREICSLLLCAPQRHRLLNESNTPSLASEKNTKF
jgi:hypothetical protein